MPIAMQHEGGNVYRFDVRGRWRRSDQEQCQQLLATSIGALGSVRLLFVLDGFTGWEPQGGWDDVSFFVQHGSAVERIAVVGDQRWLDDALMFAAAGIRQAPVRFFSPGALDDARRWLTA